jgi:hypothetical protein
LPLLESPIVKWRIGGLDWAGGCGLADAKNNHHLGSCSSTNARQMAGMKMWHVLTRRVA